ncbi:MBL fold metallo-hydrolase [Streptococcus halichoeri]|uniref:MBL fold metallo-hydrolase n=1 Tax=Streptococcus halichoeri TaxID=254785 RepID=UPI0013585C51|nr:MBL fold metallo-hydrolase [Streptococcus halichoeri]
MAIIKTVNTIASENTYYISNEQALLLVDPGSNGADIIKQIRRFQQPLVAILLTHTHYDHIMSLDLVRETFNFPPVYVAKKEADWLLSPKDNLSGLIRHAKLPDITTRPAEEHFQFKKPYHLHGFTFTVVETPGHSIGGVSIIFPQDQIVLTGDALFRESIGRTDLPTGNYTQLLQSIKEELLTLPNHYQVYPGHGAPTTIAHEKMANAFLH